MAGDWLKMTHALPEKPEVLAIAGKTGLNRFEVVGRLFSLWRWFDINTTDGNAVGVTSVTLDECLFGYGSNVGFVSAVIASRWLSESEDGISVVKFDEHISESAKTRAQTAKRVAKSKAKGNGNAEGNGESVTKTVPREEKRRVNSVPIGTGAAGAGQRPKTPAERRKSELWGAIKAHLVESGESKDLKAAGAVITSAIQRYDEPTALAAIEATLYAKPAGAIAYLQAACQQASGLRLNKQEELEAGNLAAAERFALGIANEIH